MILHKLFGIKDVIHIVKETAIRKSRESYISINEAISFQAVKSKRGKLVDLKKATGSLLQAYFMITLSFTVRELRTVEAIIKHTKFLSLCMPILEILILIGKFHSVFWNQNISQIAYSTNSRQHEMKQMQKFSVWSANWQINYPVIVCCDILH